MAKMQELSDYRQAMLERFSAVGFDLGAALRRLDRDGAGLSAHQAGAHLRDMERHAYLPRIERILAEDCPLLPVFDAEDWARRYPRPDRPLEAILEEFAALRQSELERLRSMPPDGWSRLGRHPVYGLRTLQWWVEKSLAHCEEHLDALQRSLIESSPVG